MSIFDKQSKLRATGRMMAAADGLILSSIDEDGPERNIGRLLYAAVIFLNSGETRELAEQLEIVKRVIETPAP